MGAWGRNRSHPLSAFNTHMAPKTVAVNRKRVLNLEESECITRDINMSLLALELSKAGFEGGKQWTLLPAIHHNANLLTGANVRHDGQHQVLQPLRNHIVFLEPHFGEQIEQLLQVQLGPLEVPKSNPSSTWSLCKSQQE